MNCAHDREVFTNKFRVLLIQRILPQYRVAFFDKLNASEKLDLTFGFGGHSADRTIMSIQPPSNWKAIKLSNWYWRQRETICWQSGVLRLIRPENIDAVIAEFNPRILTNVLALFKARMFNLPFIWWGHGVSSTRSSKIAEGVRKKLIEIADGVILYDDKAKSYLVDMGLPEEKFFVAFNSVDTRRIKLLRGDFQKNASKRRVIYVGRLLKQKNLDLLIRAFADVLSVTHQDLVLTLVGDGPVKQDLIQMTNDLGVSHAVEFKGSIFDEEILAKMYSDSLMVISPGCVGLMAIQALSFGVPLLIPDQDDHGPEANMLKDKQTVLLFESNSISSLTSQMIEIINNLELRSYLITNGVDLIERYYSLDAMVGVFENALLAAVKKKG
ncbi:glycosyltransferase family 4 protein [Candidatus Viridilinea mediisalina]|uniref:Glycosyl transferase family 1 domain-containing protein n=1 Tax=Candidatus Viridilinea mediisalina TaxID=2024553 RepID=A0A2A6RGL2_9CHLR|nr:glycosyltransferase family 4 protein [Candidatus Viridilinea mediisalina]PDW02026.1 hypothetical protein CJ255_16115 [Candidatus Viridilinea mediisalina]